MNSLLNHVRQHTTGPLGTTLVIGAGNGSALANWRELRSTRLVMAEAHPRQAEGLARRLRSDLGEELLAVAITPADQQTAALHALNNPAYSSLQPPRGLMDYYPNLRIEAPLQVPAISLARLLEQQALNADGDNLLVLSAPGQAFELLQGAPRDSLQAFRWLLINTSSEPLYENEREPAGVSAFLSSMGFDLVMDDPDALYPQASLLFVRNDTALRALRLEREVDTLRNRLTEASQQASTREAELQTQLSEQSAALAEQAKLASERQARLDQLTKEKTELTATLDTLTKDKEALAQARDEQAKLATERQAQLDQLAKGKAELTAVRDALAKDKTALTQARDEQAKLLTERQAQLDQLTEEKAELGSDCQRQLEELAAQKNALVAERDALRKENTGLASDCGKLKQTVAEGHQRLLLMKEEVIKANTQVELIKDLLLRESGL
ncbi:hypothetical protein [Pseudomonas sp. Marseille-QA0892]